MRHLEKDLYKFLLVCHDDEQVIVNVNFMLFMEEGKLSRCYLMLDMFCPSCRLYKIKIRIRIRITGLFILYYCGYMDINQFESARHLHIPMKKVWTSFDFLAT